MVLTFSIDNFSWKRLYGFESFFLFCVDRIKPMCSITLDTVSINNLIRILTPDTWGQCIKKVINIVFQCNVFRPIEQQNSMTIQRFIELDV